MKWLSRLFGADKPESPGFVTAAVPEEEMVRRAKIRKDVCVTVVSRGAQGDVTAECRKCSARMGHLLKDQLVWFLCPSCGGATFSPLPNVQGALGYASRHGGTFEFDLYLLNEESRRLMPPPSVPRSGLTG
jgi:hypothetical protein